jgi:hypothetical protein
MHVKLLSINTDTEPITTEFFELPTEDRDALKAAILGLLNRHGKNSTVLLKWKSDYWTCSHTSKRGPSSTYYKQKVKYHPYSSMVD